MPQRFLRPEIRTSQRWNETSFGAQSLYVGLMTLVDDFGRYDGRPKLIHGEVFILRDDVRPQQTAAWLRELDKRDLIQVYEVEGKIYLQISRWKERSRSETSRFPEPPARESCEPLRNPAESCLLSLSHKSSPLVISHTPLPAASECEEIYQAYPRKIAKPAAIRAIRNAINRGTSRGVLLERTLQYAKTVDVEPRFIPYPATWFNQERFNDDPKTWRNGASQQPQKAKYVDPNQARIDEEYEAHRRRMEAKNK